MNRVIILSIAFFAYCNCFGAKTNPQKELLKDSVPVAQFEYVVFGSFCAMCDERHGFTMFKYINQGNSNGLMLDTTYLYYAKKDESNFSMPITDTLRLKLSKQIISQIPQSLWISKESEEFFGCPDCFDGGGFLLEIKQNGKVKRFYLDKDMPIKTQRDEEVRKFLEFLRAALKKMRPIRF